MHGRILLVDDDPNLSRLFTKVLSRQGYTVDTVMSAENAQALLRVRTYDVFLCDLNLGGERGVDLIRAMWPTLQDADTQVVVISGQDHLRDICDAIGVEFFLSKPVGTHELAHFVNRMMHVRQPAYPLAAPPARPTPSPANPRSTGQMPSISVAR